MAEIINELTLDVARENRIQAVLGKQYDYKSRYLKVQIANNGEPIFVTAGTVVTINATRADKQSNSFLGVVNDDGTVTVPITQWMLALDAYVKCDISMTDPQGRKLTTANFTVEVEHSNYTGGNLAEVTASIGSSTGITAANVDGTTFIGKVGTAEEKTYTFSYDGSKWTLDSSAVTLGDYGITVVGTPASGDTVTVTVKENTGGLLVDLLANIAEVGDAVNKKANTDGYYSSLGAGTADQLNSPDGTTDNSAFTFRTTAGSESVTTENVRIKSIRGKTIVWNQLFDKNATPNRNSTAITYTVDGDVSTLTTTSAITTSRFNFLCPTVSGHKYLVCAQSLEWTSPNHSNLYVGEESNPDMASYATLTSSDLSKFFTATGDTCYIKGYISYSAGDYVFKMRGAQLFDLTLMFGAGNEPASATEFRTMFPKGYYEYNAGQVLSTKPSGMVTVGFNQLKLSGRTEVSDDRTPASVYTDVDSDVLYKGLAANGYLQASRIEKYAISDSSISLKGTADAYGIGIPTRAFPNTAYHIHITGTGAYVRVSYLDSGKKIIGFTDTENPIDSFTTPANCAYMILVFLARPAGTEVSFENICVNLSWSGSKNGTYEPYEKRTRAVDTATYFPNGMRSAGSAYDEMDFERRKAIKRIGVVDLGGLNWFYEPTTPNERFVASVDGIKIVSGSAKGNLVCSKYTTTSVDDVYSHTADKTIAVHNTAEQVWVYDTAYTDAATFKAAMSGVMLYYELATPTEFDIPDTVSNIYYADDWGTEEWMQDASATIPVPVPATLFYMRNLVDEIRNVRKNCLETADSLDNLLAALGTACGGTFTKTWSDTDQEWKFTFAASAASQTAETEVAT